jgi:histone H3/H4
MSDNEDNAASASREQDRFLPIANIARIMKKTLPGNAKIAKDAKEVQMFTLKTTMNCEIIR